MSVLSVIPSKAVFEEVAQTLSVNESFIEKDWHTVQVISALSKVYSSDFELIFSGGTALSKAHGLIQRFSEDIDFRVMADHNLLTRGTRSNLKKSIIKSLQLSDFTIRDQNVIARDENRFFSIKIEYKTEFVRSNALRPHILVEMALQNPLLPPKKLSVRSFIAKITGQSPEVKQISCVSPVEIAADKLSAIVWRIPDRIRGELYDDPAIVRHIHDLCILEPIVTSEDSFIKLVKIAMLKDNERSKKNKNFSGLTMQEKFNQVLSVIDSDSEYAEEYYRFVKGVSYAPQELIPDFHTAIAAVRRITSHILTREFLDKLEPVEKAMEI
jgi:predicted nucleotidyltransferase component of viral defense system